MAGLGVLEVTDASFDQEVLRSEQPVLVDFWAVWCGPCKAIGPIVDSIAATYAGKLKVAKVNVDEMRPPRRGLAFAAFRRFCFSRAAKWPIRLWALCPRT